MVALAGPAIRVVMQGRIDTSQTWSVSIWNQVVTTVGTGFTQAQLNTLAADMDTIAQTCFSTYASSVHPDTDFRQTSVYHYPATVLNSTQVAVSPARAAAVGTGTGNLPVQCSCVVSLHTGTSGRSGRGRNYLPFTGAILTTHHQFNTTPITNAAIAYQAMLQSFLSYTSGGSNVASLIPSVASHVTGLMYPITQVTVDSDPDVQRRRSDKILASTQVARVV